MAEMELKKCTICGRAVIEKYRPFCSPRCADVDLGRWLGETYRAPTNEVTDEEDSIRDQDEAEED